MHLVECIDTIKVASVVLRGRVFEELNAPPWDDYLQFVQCLFEE